MYAKLLINSGTLAVLASAIISPIALANDVETFSFKKNIGSVWVGDVTIEQGIISGRSPSASGGYINWTAEGAQITMNIRTPRCRNQFHTEGSVIVKYTNGEAKITRTLEIGSLQEDTNLTPSWTVRGNYGNPTNGRINVITNVTCVHHGNKDSAIPNPFGW
ncbi:hypothetical protein [Microcoleus sp.]|uniref:hypothetical protein n=1 Tax=Microcoleus sp. TaxID=44472 RepID=UPI0035232086